MLSLSQQYQSLLDGYIAKRDAQLPAIENDMLRVVKATIFAGVEAYIKACKFENADAVEGEFDLSQCRENITHLLTLAAEHGFTFSKEVGDIANDFNFSEPAKADFLTIKNFQYFRKRERDQRAAVCYVIEVMLNEVKHPGQVDMLLFIIKIWLSDKCFGKKKLHQEIKAKLEAAQKSAETMQAEIATINLTCSENIAKCNSKAMQAIFRIANLWDNLPAAREAVAKLLHQSEGKCRDLQVSLSAIKAQFEQNATELALLAELIKRIGCIDLLQRDRNKHNAELEAYRKILTELPASAAETERMTAEKNCRTTSYLVETYDDLISQHTQWVSTQLTVLNIAQFDISAKRSRLQLANQTLAAQIAELQGQIERAQAEISTIQAELDAYALLSDWDPAKAKHEQFAESWQEFFSIFEQKVLPTLQEFGVTSCIVTRLITLAWQELRPMPDASLSAVAHSGLAAIPGAGSGLSAGAAAACSASTKMEVGNV
jgi:hypothetical protein